MSVVARLVQHLQLAPTEIEATCFAVCAILIYPFLLRRPKNVDTPIAIGVYNTIPQKVLELKLEQYGKPVKQRTPTRQLGEKKPSFRTKGSEQVPMALAAGYPGRPPDDIGLPAVRKKDLIFLYLVGIAL